MSIKIMSNHANVIDGVDYSIGSLLYFDDLDEGTQEAIKNDIMGFSKSFAITINEFVNTLNFKVMEMPYDDYDCKIEYFFKYDDKAKKIYDEGSLSAKQKILLKENDLDEETISFIVNEVRIFNKKLDMILKSNKGENPDAPWKNLNIVILGKAIEIYNNARVDISSGKIVSIN